MTDPAGLRAHCPDNARTADLYDEEIPTMNAQHSGAPRPQRRSLRPVMTATLLAWALGTAAQAQVAPPPAEGAFVPTPPSVPSPSSLGGDARLPRTSTPILVDGAVAPVQRELGKRDDNLTIDVNAYRVADDAPEALRQALATITAPYVGKGRSYEDLVNAASDITRYLQRDLGYYLGYAYIPEQAPKEGVITIGVLVGKLDRYVLNCDESQPLPVRCEVIQSYLDQLRTGDVLTVQAVERAVFLIGDLRGINLRAEVKEGSQPGTAILEFTPKADPQWNGKVDVDANGSRFIGRERIGAMLSYDSPFGRGDGITLSGLGSVNGGMQFVLLGYNTPLFGNGLKVGASVSGLRYQLSEVEFPLGLEGTGVTVNAFALYPWLRSRNINLFALGSLDHKQYDDSAAGSSTLKQADVLGLGVTGDFRDALFGGGVNTFQASMNLGTLRFPDGRPQGLDSAARFAKLNLAYTRLQALPVERLMVYGSVHGQYALHNLDTTEQFRIGGPDGVRAFAPGEGTGDSGLVATGELRWLPPESLFDRWARELVFSVFGDAAYVLLRHDPTQIPRAANYRNEARYAGAGLSVVWARQKAYSMRMSVAWKLRGTATGDTLARDPRIYVQASYYF